MTSHSLRAKALATLLLMSAATAVAASCTKPSEAASAKSWHATGAVKSFGPSRAFVNIAHDEIAGYMSAMTMSFEPEKAAQFDGLVAGDRVAFDFSETADGRRVLSRIEKQR